MIRPTVGLLLLLCIVCGCNENRPGTIEELPPPAGSEWVSRVDEEHRAAIQLGRYASGQASDQRLRNYGWDMLAFHRIMQRRLEAIAQQNRIPLKDTIDGIYQQLIKDMAAKAGNNFDSSFMSVMAEREKAMIMVLDQIILSRPLSGLHFFALADRDSVQHHLDRLKDIKDSINVKRKRWVQL